MRYESWRPYLFTNAREDNKKGHEQGDEHHAESDGGNIARHGRPVGSVIQRRSAVVTERIEPASHGRNLEKKQEKKKRAWAGSFFTVRPRNTLECVLPLLHYT